MNKSFIFVLFAQFFSAFADNFLFIVAIAQLKILFGSDTNLLGLLQEAFVIAFIALAPFVGVFADKFAKNRVMLLANSIKLFGILLMIGGFDIVYAYLIVGIGAAIYSPAKYGILVQILPKEMLVRANGMLEGSTIFAILAGVLSGGIAVDAWGVGMAFDSVALLYILALVCTVFIGNIAPEKANAQMNVILLIKNFWQSIKSLAHDQQTKIALIGTSVFWGLGSMLRIFLFMWIPFIFGITDNATPSYFMGILSVGIVVGAVVASKYYHIENAVKSIQYGLYLAVALLLVALSDMVYVSMFLFFLIGIFGGIFVIPLNALVQEKGHESIGAGSALAVQNFFENFSMLLFVAVFHFAVSRDISLALFLMFFSLMLFGVMLRLRHKHFMYKEFL